MTSLATALTRHVTARTRLTARTLLGRLVEADRRYRDRRHVEGLPKERLVDAGLWRAPGHLVRKPR